MSKRLVDNLNSNYFDAANSMRPKWKRQKVIVYVESYDDIFFWRDVLAEFETDKLGFEVVLPSRTNLSRGKKTAIMNRLGQGLGTSMIACVDADYDYLLQGHSPVSHWILSNPYVVHTYVYSIENFQCYAPSLHEVSVMSTLNDRKIFDFEAYLSAFSRIIYDLFVWAIWINREGLGQQFSLSSFGNITKIQNLNIFKPEVALEELRRNVNRKLAWLQRNYPEAKGRINPLKEELASLGVQPDNVYMYIQGHHLMENIVMEAMTPVCQSLRRAREKEIKQLATAKQQLDNELACYQHSQADVVQMLRRNTRFKDSPQYKQLQEHLRSLIAMITISDHKTTNVNLTNIDSDES